MSDPQQCPFCQQGFTEQDWKITLTTGETAHVQCVEVDARRARRGRAYRAWRDLFTAMLILAAILTAGLAWPWEGVTLYAAGGASAVLYWHSHAVYWRSAGVRLRRWWRRRS